MTASDESVVSDDPAGQHNPQVSQGSLDWICLAVADLVGLPTGLQEAYQSGFSYV